MLILVFVLCITLTYAERGDYEGESFIGKRWHEAKPDSLIVVDPAADAQRALDTAKAGNMEDALNARTCVPACDGDDETCQEITYIADTFVYPTRADFLNAVNVMDYCRGNTRTEYFGPPEFNWIPQNPKEPATAYDNLKLGDISCGKCRWCNRNWVSTDFFKGTGYWSYWDRETIGDRAVRLFRLASLYFSDDPVGLMSAWNLVASYGKIYRTLPVEDTCESYGFNTIPTQVCNPTELSDYNEPFEWFINVSPRDDTFVKCGKTHYRIDRVDSSTGYIHLSSTSASNFDTQGGEVQICRVNAQEIPSLLPYQDNWENRIALGSIVNAQVAIIAWARAQCNSYNNGACLLGVHDISKEEGFSLAVPVVIPLVEVEFAKFEFNKDGYNLIVRKNAVFIRETQETAKMVSLGIGIGVSLNKVPGGKSVLKTGFGSLKNAMKKGAKANARRPPTKTFFDKVRDQAKDIKKKAKQIKDAVKRRDKKAVKQHVKNFVDQHKAEAKEFVKEKATEMAQEYAEEKVEEMIEAGNEEFEGWLEEQYGPEFVEEKQLLENDLGQMKDGDRDEQKAWLADHLTEAIMQPIEVEYWFEFGSCVGRCDAIAKYDWIGITGSISAFDSIGASASYYNIVQSALVVSTDSEGFNDAINMVMSLNPVTRAFSNFVQGMIPGTWTRHLFAASAQLAIPNPVAMAAAKAEGGINGILESIKLTLKYEAGTSSTIESDSSVGLTQYTEENATKIRRLRLESNTKLNVMQAYVKPFVQAPAAVNKAVGPADKMNSLKTYIECPANAVVSKINPYECYQCAINSVVSSGSCVPYVFDETAEDAPMPIDMVNFFEMDFRNDDIGMKSIDDFNIKLEQDIPYTVDSKSIFRVPSLRKHVRGVPKVRNIDADTSYIHGSSVNPLHHILHKNLISFNWVDTTSDNKVILSEELNFNQVPVKTCDYFGLTTIDLHEAYGSLNSGFLHSHVVPYVQDIDESITTHNFMEKTLRKQCGEEYEPAYIPAGMSFHQTMVKHNKRWHSKINDNSNNPNRRFGLIPVREPDCSYEWKCICAPQSSFRYDTYGNIKNSQLESNQMVVPVTSLRECETALRFWNHHTLHRDDIQTQWSQIYAQSEVEELPIYKSSSSIYGCFTDGAKFSFNTNVGNSGAGYGCTHDNNVVKIVTFEMHSQTAFSLDNTSHVYLLDNDKMKHRLLNQGVEIASKDFVGSLFHSDDTTIKSYRQLVSDAYRIDADTSLRLVNDHMFFIHTKNGERTSPFVLQTEKSFYRLYLQRTRHKIMNTPKIAKLMASVAETDLPAYEHSGDLFTPGYPDANGNLVYYDAYFDQFQSFEDTGTSYDTLVKVPIVHIYSGQNKVATAHNMYMKKMTCMNSLAPHNRTVYLKSNSQKSESHLINGECEDGYVGKFCDTPVMTVFESTDTKLPNITGQLNGAFCGDVYNHVPLNGASCEDRPIYASRHCKEGMGMITVTHVDRDPENWIDSNGFSNVYTYKNVEHFQCVLCPEYTSSPEGDYICRPTAFPNCNKAYFEANPTETSCNHRCMPGWYGRDCDIQLFETKQIEESHYSSFLDKYFDIIDGKPHSETASWGNSDSRPSSVPPQLHTVDGIPYADNEILTQPKYLTCNAGFVPQRLTTEELELNMRMTPAGALNTEEAKISARFANTCGGYKCTRCPPTFYEKNQICVPCPSIRQVAGWALGETGDSANTCMHVNVPKGNFFDALKPMCKHKPYIEYEASIEAAGGVTLYDDYLLRDLYGETAQSRQRLEQRCTQSAWAGFCLHDRDITNQTMCELTSLETSVPSHAKYTTHCSEWAHHPVGGLGGYQASVNQTYCNIAREGRRHKLVGRTVFPNGLSGSKPNHDRTDVEECADYEICNGEEIVGCQPGYIWYRDTPDHTDAECQACNNDTSIADLHPEKDPYEYCDGTPYFKCANTATYIDLDPNLFGEDAQGVKDYVGSRSTWSRSTTERFEVNYWNFAVPQQTKYTFSAPDYYYKQREYEHGHEALQTNTSCYPTPDGYYTLPGLEGSWQKQPCDESYRNLCVHRTSHKPVGQMLSTTDVEKYPNSNAVLYQAYDEIRRFEPDVVCTPGYLPNGCQKEYCTREGQSNCWCGDEELFCTLGCVNNVCRATCGNEMCNPDTEVCFGFNDVSSGVSFASCEKKCIPPIDNFCVVNDLTVGAIRYCRHYNEDYDKPPLSINNYESPCLDEVPSIAETQCTSPSEQGCFCGRHFINQGDSIHFGCFERKLEPKCTILQDDRTCTYLSSPHGKCVCGNELTEKCFANKEDKCGVFGTALPSCERKIAENLDGACRVTNLNDPLPEHGDASGSLYTLEDECETYLTREQCMIVAETYDLMFYEDSSRLFSEGCNYRDGRIIYNSFESTYVSVDVTETCPFGSVTPGIGGTSDWHKTQPTNALWREYECRNVFEDLDIPFRRVLYGLESANKENTTGYRYDGCQEDGTVVQFNMNNRFLGLGTRMCLYSSPYILPDAEYDTGYKSICYASQYNFIDPVKCAHKDSTIHLTTAFGNIDEIPSVEALCLCDNCTDIDGLHGCMDRIATNFDMYATIPAKCIY